MPRDRAGDTVTLLQRIQQGDQQAFDDLYLRYRDRLLFAIRCRLGPALRARLESEDVLHSVVRDALADLQRFAPRDDGALGRYLHVCVLNKIRKKAAFHGRERRAAEVPLSDSLADRVPEPARDLRYLDAERYERLEAALGRLPEDMRTVVLLHRCEGMTFEEAAEALGRSRDATAKLYQRAIARLGVALGGA
jgi:RNA polymerase sigma-70 factor (ECF subfamily)